MGLGRRGRTGCDVAEDGELGRELHVGPEKTTEKRSERSFPKPFVHGMEDELVASVSISVVKD